MQFLELLSRRRIITLAMVFAVGILCAAVTAARANSIPYHTIRGVPPAVNRLGRLIAQEQRNVVPPGGDEANPGFSAADQKAFERSNRLQGIVNRFKSGATFAQGVAALHTLPQTTRERVLTRFRQPLYPTWAQNGRIGPDGTTDAGYAVEHEIASALTNAVKGTLQGHTHRARRVRRTR